MPDLKVFDAWALLTWLLNQPAAVQVEALLQKADQGEQEIVMSWINVGEVYHMAARKVDQAKAEEFLKRLPSLPLRLVSPRRYHGSCPAEIDAAHFLCGHIRRCPCAG